MAKSLLDKAKSLARIKTSSHYTEEDIELALAWVNDEIGIKQISAVKGINNVSVYVFLARALKQWLNEKR